MRKIQAISLIYLLIPFVLFCISWLQPVVCVFTLSVLAWSLIKIFHIPEVLHQTSQPKDSTQMIAIFVLGIWVLFSGIGGLAFQNHDFHWRNAIFRDLIQFHWPVVYPDTGQGPAALVYYFGFWLPAALVGKILGWEAANTFLWGWTWLGVVLVVKLISSRIKAPLLLISLFFIFFSGMDAIGILLLRSIKIVTYPDLWPPIQHLEWWAQGIQYSSNTTQLYWVYNQALPGWICTALVMCGINRRLVFFVWSLCFFFAPLPAVGLALIIPFELIKPLIQAQPYQGVGKFSYRVFTFFTNTFHDILSVENVFGGGAILFFSYMFYRTNPTSSKVSLTNNTPVYFLFLIIFLLCEGGLLWLYLSSTHKRDFLWYPIGLFLLVIPLVKLGYSGDFSMRASIPALFYLMVWTGERILKKIEIQSMTPDTILIFLFVILGVLTPLSEINRSIYRTTSYYLCPSTHIPILCSRGEWKPTLIKVDPDNPNYLPEYDHPGSLIADDLISLSGRKIENLPNFVAKVNPSPITRFLYKLPDWVNLTNPETLRSLP